MSLVTQISALVAKIANITKSKADISYVDDLIALKTGPAHIMKTTNISVTSTRVELPTTPLIDRKSIIIYNKSTNVTIFIGDNTVLDTKGTPILPGRKEAYDIDTGLFAICKTGETCNITINELA